MRKTIAFAAAAFLATTAMGTPIFAQAGTPPQPSESGADGSGIPKGDPSTHRPDKHASRYKTTHRMHPSRISRAQNAAKHRADVNNN